MTKQEIEQNNKVLYLNIKQNFFDEIIAGTKTQEFREVKPTTIKKLLQLDEKGFEIEGEDGNSLPVKYDVIHFRVGMNKVADEAYVEVKDTHVEVLMFLINDKGQYLTNDDGGLIIWEPAMDEKYHEELPHAPFEYVTDEKGHTLFDEDGIPVAPEFDEEGFCTNGLLWTVQQVIYDLGKVIEKNIVSK